MQVQVLIHYEYFIIIKVVLGMLKVHWNMVGGFCFIWGILHLRVFWYILGVLLSILNELWSMLEVL